MIPDKELRVKQAQSSLKGQQKLLARKRLRKAKAIVQLESRSDRGLYLT
jgi:hypothetical protein